MDEEREHDSGDPGDPGVYVKHKGEDQEDRQTEDAWV
jgi:hypothetical protein